MIDNNIINVLKCARSAAILSHIMPDGDSIGSMLALYSVLKRMGKEAEIFSCDNVSPVYSFLPGYDEIKKCSDAVKRKYDVLIVLDCGNMDRTGDCCSDIIKYAAASINIDHHVSNSMFADFNYVDTNASSTGEIIYQIIKSMGVVILKEEASCLYTAILTDTGCFKYSNTSLETHRIAGDLISSGIEFGDIHDLMYRNYSFSTVKVLGRVLSSIELFNDGQIALMQLLKENFEGFKLQDVDTTDFINYARDISTVEAAVFIKQVSPNEYKVSLRSKHRLDVRAVCEKYGGGGHVRAAGCTINESLQKVRDIIINELRQALKGEVV